VLCASWACLTTLLRLLFFFDDNPPLTVGSRAKLSGLASLRAEESRWGKDDVKMLQSNEGEWQRAGWIGQRFACWALFHLPIELSLSEKLPPPCLFCSCAWQGSLAVRYLVGGRHAHAGSERASLYRPEAKKTASEEDRFLWVGGVRENGRTNALRALLAVPGR